MDNKSKPKFCIIFIMIFNFILLNCISINITNNFLVLNSKILGLNGNNSDLPLQGKYIGWVQTHNETNPLNHYDTTLGDVQNMGAILDNITTEINSSLLNSYDILIIEEKGLNWTSNELNNLYNWVLAGGSLYILGDNCDPAQVNVSAKFDVFYDGTDLLQGPLIFNTKYPILKGVSSIYTYWPSASIDLQKSRDDLMIIAWKESNEPMIIALQVGSGRILWNVDADGMIEESSISQYDNHLFANNSWLWLGGILGNEYTQNPPNEWLILLLIYEKSIIFPIDLIILIIIGSLVAIISITIYFYYRKKIYNSKKKTNLS